MKEATFRERAPGAPEPHLEPSPHDPATRGLVDYVERRFDAKVLRVQALGSDTGGQTTAKRDGYGVPFRIWLRDSKGLERQCVLHFSKPNGFGHERRSDRVQQQVLAWDTFGQQPRHVGVLDVGTTRADGSLVSWADAGEPFLLTEWADGAPYADDLRRLAHGGPLTQFDRGRARTLVAHLAELHRRVGGDVTRWERCLRDTVGGGEGLFGICDAFGVDSVHQSRLMMIEQLAAAARWRLKRRAHRLSRTHGDFHPFNIVFRDGSDFSLLDASRGGVGEPADDVTALAVNYLFFAVEHRERWRGVFSVLWDEWWATYLEQTRDHELLECAGLFLAWRSVVVACPRFYPALSEDARETLLGFAEQVLLEERFDPTSVHELFR